MAKKGINKVMLVGNVGNEPEIKATPGGSFVVNFSLATSETWQDKKTMQRKETTEWHRIVFFNKPAELIGDMVHKGTKLYVEGSIRTRKWQDNMGRDQYTTEIVGNEFQILSEKKIAQQDDVYGNRATAEKEVDYDFEDEIPF